MRAVIFTGPSLSPQEAGRILDAIYLPPAKQGDVVSAMYRFQPDVIGIVDGAMHPHLAVWHKDILFALENGVAVYGSSGVGAVRAIEVRHAGMVGVGMVFEQLRGRGVFSDDEVMVVYEEKGGDYKRLSESAVNLRATFRAAQERAVVDAAGCEMLVEIAASIPYQDRTLPLIFRKASERGMSPGLIGRLEEFCEREYVDLQKLDAVALVETIRDLPERDAAGRNRNVIDDMDTPILHILKYRDRDICHDGVNMPLYALGDYVAVNHPETGALAARAQNRYLSECLADIFSVEACEDEIAAEAASFRKRHGLGDDSSFQTWIRDNDLIMEEFNEIMRQSARVRKLHAWLRVRMHYKRLTKLILDELRLNDQYREWAARAAGAERVCARDEEAFARMFQETDIKQLIGEHVRAAGHPRAEDFVETIRGAGLSVQELKSALIKTRMARDHYVRLTARALDSCDDEKRDG